MKHYTCLSAPTYHYGNYSLTTIQPEQIERIRQWRNVQMDVLRQHQLITPEQQHRYFTQEVWPELHSNEPDKILLSFFYAHQHIGYGGLVHLAWKHRRGEISFLVAPERARETEQYQQDFSHYLKIIQQVAFQNLRLNRVFTETYAQRKSHIAILEACGMKREGTLREHVAIDGRYEDALIHGCLRNECGI